MRETPNYMKPVSFDEAIRSATQRLNNSVDDIFESGKESRIKDLEDMRFEDSFILGIKNYHDLGNQNGP